MHPWGRWKSHHIFNCKTLDAKTNYNRWPQLMVSMKWWKVHEHMPTGDVIGIALKSYSAAKSDQDLSLNF